MDSGWYVLPFLVLSTETDLIFLQCVQGYFIKATSLPRFWYYWAHWIVSFS